MIRVVYFIGLFLFVAPQLRAQTVVTDTLAADTLQQVSVTDSALIPAATITPKKIGLYSAIVPGLGQIYNKQYWKLPIIYVGVGVAVYFVADNLSNYNAFRRELAGRYSNDPGFVSQFPEYNDETLARGRDYYRQNLDLTVLLTALGYGLQVMDAVVFAHLKNFDISENISFKARPVVMPQGGLGLGLVVNFK